MGCDQCDHGWITFDDGSVARCTCVVAPPQEAVQAVQTAMDTEGPALHRGASGAQQAAADSLTLADLSDRRRATLQAVAGYPEGVTCDALEVALGRSHQSVSAVLNWLERHGLVERAWRVTRPTRSGRPANPYSLTWLGASLLANDTTP